MRTVLVIGLALVALLLVPVVLVAVRRIRERLSLRTGFSALGEWLWTNSGIAAQTMRESCRNTSCLANQVRRTIRSGMGSFGVEVSAPDPPQVRGDDTTVTGARAQLLFDLPARRQVYCREVYLILTCPFA